MKKILILAVLLVGITGIAQERNRKHQGNSMEEFTPEQQSQLMLKEMTLSLDLTETQQKEMSLIISDKIAKKEAQKAERKALKEKGTKPTSDELFAMQMKHLDDQIATKKRVEKVLNTKQYEKWCSFQGENKNKSPKMSKGKQQGKRQG